jgi:hypothetical protein
MNKTFFLCVISSVTITACTDQPGTSGSATAPVATTGTAPAYPVPATTATLATAANPAVAPTASTAPTLASAPTPVTTPTSENYRLYTDSDLQIYADTLDLRIQQALKNNNSSEAQTLAAKRQELIAEFNRRGLKRHPVESVPRTRYSRKVDHRRSRVIQPRTKANPSGAGLPGEE